MSIHTLDSSECIHCENPSHVIPKDSFPKHVLCCIPIIGTIASCIFAATVLQALERPRLFSRDQMIRILEIRNHYIICDIIRSMLTVAALVVLIITSLLPLTFGFIIIGVQTALTGFSIFKLISNYNLMKEYTTTGHAGALKKVW